MASPLLLLAATIASCVATGYATGPFLNQLPNVIVVKDFPVNPINSPPPGMSPTNSSFTPTLQAGQGLLNITWALNLTSSNTTRDLIASFKYVRPYICFTPGVDRPWRKANNNLAKDNQVRVLTLSFRLDSYFILCLCSRKWLSSFDTLFL